MFAFLKSLFRKSVDSIVADIQAKVEALHIAADFHSAEAQVHAEAVQAKIKLTNAASAEAGRAKAIATKLEALIS